MRQGGTEQTYLDRTIVAAAHQPKLIARHGPHTLDVSEERTLNLARVDIPDFDSVIEAA